MSEEIIGKVAVTVLMLVCVALGFWIRNLWELVDGRHAFRVFKERRAFKAQQEQERQAAEQRMRELETETDEQYWARISASHTKLMDTSK